MIIFLYWLCALAQLASTDRVADVAFMSPVQHAAMAGDAVVIVTHAASDRVVAEAGESRAWIRPGRAGVGYTWRGTDELIVVGSDWWYASLDGVDGRPATTFVKSDGSRTTHRSPAAGPVKSYLIAFPGDEPRALEFSSTLDGTLVRELDWAGVVRSWELPRDHDLWPHMTAERLPDGRIALFSSRDGLALILLSDGGRVETRVLRNLHISQFDTAIDDTGRIAIVVANNQGRNIEVAIDDGTGELEWRVLRRGARVMGRLREVQVVRGANGFVAAWINEGAQRRIEAAQLGVENGVVGIGNASPRGDTAFFDVAAADDELIFFWDDGEHLSRRRIPASLSGVAVIDAAKRLCDHATE